MNENRPSSVSDRIKVCYSGGHSEWLPGLLSDTQIAHLALMHEMIDPFHGVAVREVTKYEDDPDDQPPNPEKRKVISYGLTSYGYDIRVADEFKVFAATGHNVVVDPKDMDSRSFVSMRHDSVVIPPNSFVLARSIERFKMPRDVLAIVVGKSTYARCGLVVNCTPLEPEWTGYLTIEISNTTPLPARVHAFEGIAQLLFFNGSRPCSMSYAEKNAGQPGKYQDQPPEIITPRM